MAPHIVLAADEVGLGFARLDDIVLRSESQPVYRRRGGWLRPEGTLMRCIAFRNGERLVWADVTAGLGEDDRRALADTCRWLDRANHGHASETTVDLFLRPLHEASAPGAPPRDDFPAGPPGPVWHPVSARRDDRDVAARVEAIRSAGLRVCLDDIAERRDIDRLAAEHRPEAVRIRAAWFARLAAEAPLLRLLGKLTDSLHHGGIEVLVEGADDDARLAGAIECGADLIAGRALAPFAPTGAGFDMTPLEVGTLLSRQGRVLPLAARRSIHQQR